jgi:hypothetical protein
MHLKTGSSFGLTVSYELQTGSGHFIAFPSKLKPDSLKRQPAMKFAHQHHWHGAADCFRYPCNSSSSTVDASSFVVPCKLQSIQQFQPNTKVLQADLRLLRAVCNAWRAVQQRQHWQQAVAISNHHSLPFNL